ncbi:DUF4159 domain-containing protein [Fodinibius sp. Rm-B-1B1-1]|uniref:DUF4159 domain-containing protein n=1 Tax=Fodinibius alkaliphilus TaxID=3140241 RepID=UPI00315ADB6F
MIRQSLIIFVLLLLLAISFSWPAAAQDTNSFNLARIKYSGGGDWYNNPSSLRNLAEFARQHVPIAINPEYDDVEVGSPDLFDYPFAFLTGHGNITLNQAEASNLRDYLHNGGFLYVDDDYGLDEHFREVIQQVFPNEKLVELPFAHPIYHQVFSFDEGLPKIHEHDGKPPQGFGIFLDGRLALFYTYETNLGDGWANPDIHNDPAAIREQALQMGTNILIYALTQGQ